MMSEAARTERRRRRVQPAAARLPHDYVSTGHLPETETVIESVRLAYERFRNDTDGRNSDVYPALSRTPSQLFGICVVGANGRVHAIGDADHPFSIMSVSKPFVFALVCGVLGAAAARDRIGVNATGLPFNALAAIERGHDGRTNPMVNPGAIATTSMAPGDTADARWQFIRQGLSRFAGRPLALNEEIYGCASGSNFRNRSIAGLLHSYRLLDLDPVEAIDLYTRQCSLDVTATDLAVMGATLADGGVNPLTREQVVNADSCRYALAVMATAGLYEASGDWLFDVGLPGKSGIGGGIVTVSPGKGGLGTFAPPLDRAGNSVQGQLVARFLAAQLGMNLFASKPET